MSYFVTGATGFLGRFLVDKLLRQRKGTVHVLVRKGSEPKLDAIAERMGWDRKRVIVVTGDLSKPKLGLPAAQVKALSGKIQHFFHLAAIYDLAADAESQRIANTEEPGCTGHEITHSRGPENEGRRCQPKLLTCQTCGVLSNGRGLALTASGGRAIRLASPKPRGAPPWPT